MPMIRCEANLHFYDPARHSACPHCRVVEVGSTQGASTDDILETDDIHKKDRKDDSHTRKPDDPLNRGDGATVGLKGDLTRRQGIDPVVGWLVCTDGAAMGKDFRLFDGNNTIGRDGEANRVQITGDESISRKSHAVIQFDPRKAAFFIYSSPEARNPTRVNGDIIREWVELHAHDVIQLGQTALIFVPLCNDQFRWAETVLAGKTTP